MSEGQEGHTGNSEMSSAAIDSLLVLSEAVPPPRNSSPVARPIAMWLP